MMLSFSIIQRVLLTLLVQTAQSTGLNSQTAVRRLKEAGLNARKPVIRPLLTEIHKQNLQNGHADTCVGAKINGLVFFSQTSLGLKSTTPIDVFCAIERRVNGSNRTKLSK